LTWRRAIVAVLTAFALLAGVTVATNQSAEATQGNAGWDTAEPLELQAYVMAGETLYATATTLASRPLQIRVMDPEGNVWTTGGSRSSATTGIWTIRITSNAKYNWNVEVRSGGVALPGRLFTERLDTSQSSSEYYDSKSYWAINENGYLFEIELLDFNGILWSMWLDAVGNRAPGSGCMPAYVSVQGNTSVDRCGSQFKIFLDPPDPTLPQTALRPDGSYDWLILPPTSPATIAVTDFVFVPTVPGGAAGTFEFDMAGFVGNYFLQVDVNNNGSYDDAIDRSITIPGNLGHVVQAFDGLDGEGQAIPLDSEFEARVYFPYGSEIHLAQFDVEQRGGLRMTRLNGPNAPDSTIHWDDTHLAAVITTTPIKDGRAGFDSAVPGGIHGWRDSSAGGQWGDERSIDDWAYGPFLDYTAALLRARPPKTANPASGTPVAQGQTVAYTLHFDNDGTAPMPFDGVDDLSGVLDDADIVTAPTASDPGLTVGPVGLDGKLPIHGTIAPGGVDVTYAVQVKSFADQGNYTLTNFFSCNSTAGGCLPATTSHPIANLGLGLAASPTTGVGTVGDQIDYTYTVTNQSTVAFASFSIRTDDFSGGSLGSISCPAGALAPGATAQCTATYAITQSDIDAGAVVNKAVAVGLTGSGESIASNQGQVTTPVTRSAGLTVTKTATAAGTGPHTVGRLISYTLQATNTGNASLHDVTLTDQGFTGSNPLGTLTYVWPGATGVLAPGATVTATASYALAQADIDAGALTNSAVGRGLDPSNAEVQAGDTAVVSAGRASGLALSKSVRTTGLTTPPRAGQSLTYVFEVENTGNATLSSVTVTDPLAGLGTLTWTWPGTAGVLAPGATATAEATYPLTQGDIDAGSITNTASATASDPDGHAVLSSSASAQLNLTRQPALTLIKAADARAVANPAVLGNTIVYTLTGSNTGNTTLTGVTVTDLLPNLGALTYLWPDALNPGVLTPGQSVLAEVTYQVTQADINNGHIANTAKVRGQAPDGASIEASHGTDTTLSARGGLTMAKTADRSQLASPVQVGNEITYTLTATNTGTARVTGVVFHDAMTGLSTFQYTWPGAVGVLDVNETVTATATYAVTQADLDAGHIANTALVEAELPNGDPVTGGATADTDLETAGDLVLVKSANTAGLHSPARVNDVITYSFAATNNGTSKVTGVVIVDTLPRLSALTYAWPGAVGELSVGQTVTATATYTLTQADLDAGSVVNSALVRGNLPDGEPATGGDGTETLLDAAGDLVLDKTANTSGVQSPARVGDIITYSFAATNHGTTKVTGVEIVDTMPGLSAPLYTWPGLAGELSVGETVTATATYALRQSDLDTGSVSNAALVQGHLPGGGLVTGGDSAVTLLDTTGHLVLVKSANAAGVHSPARVGDIITYSFAATNNGTAKVRGVEISDPLPDLGNLFYTWPGPLGELGVGQTVTATATYTLKQSDLDAGLVANSAVVTAELPNGEPTSGGDSTVTTLDTAGDLVFDKSADTSRLHWPARVGDEMVYNFSATNTSTAKVTGVAIIDSMPGLSALTYLWPGAPGELGIGQQVTATAAYRLTQADLDGGHVSNAAIVRAELPDGNLVTSGDGTDTPLDAELGLEMVKTADASLVQVPAQVGDVIWFNFVATNTGSARVRGVEIIDRLPVSNMVINWPGATGELGAGESLTASARYILTQADLDAGQVANQAVIRGGMPDGEVVTGGDGTATPLVVDGSFDFTKSADVTGVHTPTRVGDRIDYRFTATNTGTAKVTGVSIGDQLAGLTAIIYTWPGAPGELAVGETVTATASYTVTQADLDLGRVTNSALVHADLPDGAQVEAVDGVETRLTAAGDLRLSKSADTSGVSSPARLGDTIRYGFAVTNAGTAKVRGVVIDDQLPGLGPITYTWPGTPGELGVGESMMASASYSLTQADLDASHIANTAFVSGDLPDGDPVEGTDSVDTPLEVAGQLVFDKSANTTGVQSPARVGDEITYTFRATNQGTARVTEVAITDNLPGLSELVYHWPGTPGELRVGQSVTATATYTVTQADLDAGRVTNSALVQADLPTGEPVEATDDVTTQLDAAGGFAFAKTADTTGVSSPAAVGDRIVYRFEVTNGGTAAVRGVVIEDPLPGLGAITYIWPGVPGELLVGQTMTASASYVVTQADLDAGAVVNAAVVRGDLPNGDPVEGGAGVETPLAAEGHLVFGKSADTSGLQWPVRVGDEMVYNFSATNMSTTKVTGVAITDSMPGLSALTYVWPGVAGELGIGQEVTARATYRVTQADLDAGHVSNAAVVRAELPDGAVVTGGDGTNTPLDGELGLKLEKTADPSLLHSPAEVGDILLFNFVAQNTGAARVRAVEIIDQLPVSDMVIHWPGPVGELGAGQSLTASARYVLTQADLDAGQVANQAVVRGDMPNGDPVTGGDGTATPVEVEGSFNFTKTADTTGVQTPARSGDRIVYHFTATNTGTAKVTGVSISDQLLGLGTVTYDWPGTPGELAVGETVTATASYTLSQADLDNGAVANSALVRADLPDGAVVEEAAGVETALVAAGDLRFSKTADTTSVGQPARVGDRIIYGFAATNTSTAKVRGVVIEDPLPGLGAITYHWPGTAGELGVGQTVSASASYTVTQADLDAGHVANAAVVTGDLPRGIRLQSGASVDTPLAVAGDLRFTKTANTTGVQSPAQVGDQITYTFRATNQGTAKVTGVEMVDPLPGLSPLTYAWPGTPGELGVGRTVTATASYTLTQADLDAGSVANSAVVRGDLPDGGVIDEGAGVTTPLEIEGNLVFSKTADTSGVGSPARVGDRIVYAFTAMNNGTTKVTGVEIIDQLPGLGVITYTWPGLPGELGVGQTLTASASYTLTQADLDLGHVANSALVQGDLPGGDLVEGGASEDTPLTAAGNLVLDKSADTSRLHWPVRVGDEMVYAFSVTNAGTAKVTGVMISDQLPGLSPMAYLWPGRPGELGVGQTVTATATYIITQADLDAGHVSNAALVVGDLPDGSPVTGGDGTNTPLDAELGLAIVKTADLSLVQSPAQVGDIMLFNFVATNTGTARVRAVEIIDQLPVSDMVINWPGPVGELGAGESLTASARYALTQADLDAGHVANQVVIQADMPNGDPVAGGDGTVTPVEVEGSLDFAKSADTSGVHSPAQVGDRIVYHFTATNQGTAKVVGLSISDHLSGLSAITYAWPGTPGELGVGETVTATASYTLRQADLDSGAVVNSALVQADLPDGTAVEEAAGVETPLAIAGELRFSKVANTTGVGSPARVGDTIRYEFEVINASTAKVHGVVIEDPLPGLGAITYIWPGSPEELGVGERLTAWATYSVTQADLDNGAVANSALVRGDLPGGVPVEGGDRAETLLEAAGELVLEKTADASGVGSPARVGDEIAYSFQVTNAGTTKVTSVTIVDELPGLSAITYAWPGTPGELGVGQTMTATATYAVTQADLDAGRVSNSALVQGDLPGGDPVEGGDGADTILDAAGRLVMDKQADLSGLQTPVQVGDTIAYRFAATNTGTALVTGVAIIDELPGLSALTYAWPGTPGQLGVGQTVTATASYAVTQADLDAGHIVNSALVRGDLPSGDPVSGGDGTDTPVDAAASLELVKSADVSRVQSPARVGDEITYTFAATNTSDARVRGVVIRDELSGLSALTYTWPGPAGELGVDETVTASATYTVTQADLDAGQVTNSALVRGEMPNGDPVAGGDGVVTPFETAGDLRFAKTADTAGVHSPAQVGDEIVYQFTASNAGTAKVVGVAIVDLLPGLSEITCDWPGAAGELGVGQAVTGVATYTLTAADVAGGQVVNNALIEGQLPDGATTDASDGVTVILPPPLPTTGGRIPAGVPPFAGFALMAGLALLFLGLRRSQRSDS
jgi:uncharacterized repeat protein (TIGR01451 family)